VEKINPNEQRINVPEKYSLPEKTDLRCTIEGITKDLKLELTWGDEKGPRIIKSA
jgi:hypothetical protein